MADTILQTRYSAVYDELVQLGPEKLQKLVTQLANINSRLPIEGELPASLQALSGQQRSDCILAIYSHYGARHHMPFAIDVLKSYLLHPQTDLKEVFRQGSPIDMATIKQLCVESAPLYQHFIETLLTVLNPETRAWLGVTISVDQALGSIGDSTYSLNAPQPHTQEHDWVTTLHTIRFYRLQASAPSPYDTAATLGSAFLGSLEEPLKSQAEAVLRHTQKLGLLNPLRSFANKQLVIKSPNYTKVKAKLAALTNDELYAFGLILFTGEENTLQQHDHYKACASDCSPSDMMQGVVALLEARGQTQTVNRLFQAIEDIVIRENAVVAANTLALIYLPNVVELPNWPELAGLNANEKDLVGHLKTLSIRSPILFDVIDKACAGFIDSPMLQIRIRTHCSVYWRQQISRISGDDTASALHWLTLALTLGLPVHVFKPFVGANDQNCDQLIRNPNLPAVTTSVLNMANRSQKARAIIEIALATIIEQHSGLDARVQIEPLEVYFQEQLQQLTPNGVKWLYFCLFFNHRPLQTLTFGSTNIALPSERELHAIRQLIERVFNNPKLMPTVFEMCEQAIGLGDDNWQQLKANYADQAIQNLKPISKLWFYIALHAFDITQHHEMSPTRVVSYDQADSHRLGVLSRIASQDYQNYLRVKRKLEESEPMVVNLARVERMTLAPLMLYDLPTSRMLELHLSSQLQALHLVPTLLYALHPQQANAIRDILQNQSISWPLLAMEHRQLELDNKDPSVQCALLLLLLAIRFQTVRTAILVALGCKNPTLIPFHTINFDGCRLGPTGLSYLVESILTHQYPTKVIALNECGLTAECFPMLLTLMQHKPVQRLFVKDFAFNVCQLAAIMEVVKDHDHLHKMMYRENNLLSGEDRLSYDLLDSQIRLALESRQPVYGVVDNDVQSLSDGVDALRFSSDEARPDQVTSSSSPQEKRGGPPPPS